MVSIEAPAEGMRTVSRPTVRIKLIEKTRSK